MRPKRSDRVLRSASDGKEILVLFNGGAFVRSAGFLCGPLRISAISVFNGPFQRRVRRGTQRATEMILLDRDGWGVAAVAIHNQ